MIAFKNALYDAQFLRTVGHGTYGGAEIGECFAAAETISSGNRESWHGSWMKLADRTFAAGEGSFKGGHHTSAQNAFLRASNYYRNSYIFHFEAPLPTAAVDGYRRQREAFRKAAACMDRPPEAFGIPFGDSTLPGYFCGAAETGQRPLVIAVGGYDSTAEEGYFFNAVAALARGYHCMLFDGPGQGGMLIEQCVPFRPDWEKAISAVIDAVVLRPDVDAEKIVLVGESFGGYLAPRAAAQDPRVAACVLDPAQVGLFRAILARLPFPARLKKQLPDGPNWLVTLLRALLARMATGPTAGWGLRRGMLTHAKATPWDYFVDSVRYELGDLIGQIRCPTLVCDAAGDEISAFAKVFFDRLQCEKSYLRFTADQGSGDHCISGNRALYHERIFDWLDSRLHIQSKPP